MAKIQTRGTPYERGLSQGAAVRAHASRYWRRELEQLAVRRGVASAAAVVELCAADVERWTEQMAAIHPAGVEECRGLAAGLGFSDAEYLHLPAWLSTGAFPDNR